MKIGGLIVAAGLSSRMGAFKPMPGPAAAPDGPKEPLRTESGTLAGEKP